MYNGGALVFLAADFVAAAATAATVFHRDCGLPTLLWILAPFRV